MIRRLLLTLLFVVAVYTPAKAQQNPTQGHGAPSGQCNGPYMDIDTGKLYGCKLGAYVQVGGGVPSQQCIPGAYQSQTDGATVTWALGGNVCANAILTFTTHGGSRTLNLTGLANGGSYVLEIVQDATGGEGLTLGTGCTWKVSVPGLGYSGTTVTPVSSANGIDVLSFTYDGTNCLAAFN